MTKLPDHNNDDNHNDYGVADADADADAAHLVTTADI